MDDLRKSLRMPSLSSRFRHIGTVAVDVSRSRQSGAYVESAGQPPLWYRMIEGKCPHGVKAARGATNRGVRLLIGILGCVCLQAAHNVGYGFG